MGPETRFARVAVAPIFPSNAAVAAFGLAIDRLRIVVVRPIAPPDTLADTTVDLAPDADALDLNLRVPIVTSPESVLVSIIALSGTIQLRGYRARRGFVRVRLDSVVPSFRLAYVSMANDSVAMVDPVSIKYLGEIAVDKAPQGMALNPVTRKLYVANMSGGSVSVIDLTTNKTVKSDQQLLIFRFLTHP